MSEEVTQEQINHDREGMCAEIIDVASRGLDRDGVVALAKAWCETAAMHAANEDYFRGERDKLRAVETAARGVAECFSGKEPLVLTAPSVIAEKRILAMREALAARVGDEKGRVMAKPKSWGVWGKPKQKNRAEEARWMRNDEQGDGSFKNRADAVMYQQKMAAFAGDLWDFTVCVFE